LTSKKKVVVLGAGIGGLSAGYFLARTGKFDVILLEKAPMIGGLCASFELNNFTLDHGAHKIYSVIPGILDEIKILMGERLLELPKKNRLFLRGHLVDYPLRLSNLAAVLGIKTFLQLGLGYAFEFIRGILSDKQPRSYEEYMIRRFGAPAYNLVFEPLADKVWGDPASLHPEMARARVPASGGIEVILKLLGLKKETSETNAASFFYPKKGFGDFPQAMKEVIEELGGKVILNVDVQNLVLDGDRIKSVEASVDGSQTQYRTDFLVSSIPLGILSQLIFDDADPSFVQSTKALEFRHLILVYVFVNRPLVLDDQWVFFPEKDFIFSRIFEQKQMNFDLGPENQTVICCDFTCDQDSWKWKAVDEELAEKVIESLVKAGFITADEVLDVYVKRVKNFYPRYDLDYVGKLIRINNKLQKIRNLLLTGRIGMYNYNNSDHCVDMGRYISENLASGKEPIQIWNDLEKRVSNYKIID
jgi:protoporphyrinogen oxidase